MTEDLKPTLELAAPFVSGWADPYTPQERRIMKLERQVEELENKNLVNSINRLRNKIIKFFAPKHKCCSCVEEDY